MASLGLLWLTAVYLLLLLVVAAPASMIVEANLNVVVTPMIIQVVDIGSMCTGRGSTCRWWELGRGRLHHCVSIGLSSLGSGVHLDLD
eukprot:scaffold8688_cov43-Attheya_sp.AAC.1